MTARISLFSLSPKATESLFKHLELADLFQISQLSKRAFAFVKKAVRLSDQKFSLVVVFSSSSKVTLHGKVNDDVQWKFHGNRDPERYELDKFEQSVVKIDSDEVSTKLNIVFAKKPGRCYACASNSIEDVLQFIQYLAELFNAPISQLTVIGSQLHRLELIQSVSLLRKSQRVRIDNGTVSHEEMRRILEGFECDSIRIKCSPEPNFHNDYGYDHPISIGHVQLGNCQWFKGPMLLNIDCQHLRLTDCSLTDGDVNEFLNQWTQGTSKNETPRTVELIKHCLDLEYFDIYGAGDMQPWNLYRITCCLICTRQRLPSKPGLFSATVHRATDDKKLNVIVNNQQCLSTLIIQSDFSKESS